ncbi:ATV_HP_G0008390.mRNA.1.CDS.1 [Saccharomyces cerevisiae]|nr:ATV_HP_G0008390.mRNA.1.CDS.1 [Saccharomyces cerevisiae]CAI6941658.1 ATV_HP_G0008390.mRNA.1.CDS.1 [Saccharomyces cerevisiae]
MAVKLAYGILQKPQRMNAFNQMTAMVNILGTTDNNGSTIANNNLKEKNNYIPIESFEVYLLRMYRNLYVDSSLDVVSFQNEVWAKASLLQHISNTHFLCGMMQFMRDIFNKSYWDLGREIRKLFDNCLERSLGENVTHLS